MTNITVSVAEAKKHLSELLGRVAYGGERIVIAKRGKPMALMIPPNEASAEQNLSEVQGWLKPDDAFFQTIDQIVEGRATHTPRVSKRSN